MNIPRADCSDKELVALDTVSAFREQIVADYNKGFDDNKADGNFKSYPEVMEENTTQLPVVEQHAGLAHLVGQDNLKNQISFYLEAFKETTILPHILFIGSKGSGKTEFAFALAKNLRHPATGGRPKPLLTINSSTVKNVRQFVEDICMKYVQDQVITLFFDEVHEMPVSVQTAFLSILNPNKRNMNTFRYEDAEIVFDFSKVSFVFATTDPQKLIGPFKDRCRALYMANYSHTELAQILRANIDEFEIADSIIDDIASTCRGNARNAVLVAKDGIFQFMRSRKIQCLEAKHWDELKRILNIMPLGLEEAEIQVMKALHDFPSGCSLNNLAAKTGFTTGSIMKEFEFYLVRHNLLEIGQGGRKLTIKGRKYLADYVFR
jgi:Holliday junction resolvasome RuvABC ATP-dependent DNA helicase subunit